MGYGAFPDELIKYMWRAKQPYNVSVASETAACAALTDTTYMQVRLDLRAFCAPCDARLLYCNHCRPCSFTQLLF